MQFQLSRYEYVKSIEFKTDVPLINVEKIRYYKEFDLTGSFITIEFRYSWDNSIWSNWNTLSQINLSSIEFRDNPNFWLHIKYTRHGVGSGNIHRLYLTYDSNTIVPPVPIDASIDANYLGGQPPSYYLDRSNQFGSYDNLIVTNILDASSIGIYQNRSDTSIGTELFFKGIEGRNGIVITESSHGKIFIDGKPSTEIINIGDGSANIFAGYDSSGNIELRTIIGSWPVLIHESQDRIIIGIDSSFSGEVNTGKNIGNGDVSIFSNKNSETLEFKTIKAGYGIKLSYADSSTILIDTSINTNDFIKNSSLGSKFIWDSSGYLDVSVSGGSSSASIDGGVWITNITPTNAGNVGNKVYSSGGAVLNSCLTDTSMLSVSILALPGHTNYMPIIYMDGSTVTLSSSIDKPIFIGTKNIYHSFSDASITVLHEDGAKWSTIINVDTAATIINATFIGGYAGSQTELKAVDGFDVSIMTDVPISSVIVDDYGAFIGGTFAVSGNNVRITPIIANRGNSTQALGFRLRVIKSTGTSSANYISSDHGAINGTHLVNLNNSYPIIAFGPITYPGSQQAIKSSENATIINTVSQFNTISYTSPNNELNIVNASTYENSKSATRLAGGYNIATNNLRISANRSANNASTVANTVVWIANTPASLSVGNPASRLRSGGNDGTSAQNHSITISSSQRLLSAPSLAKDTGGTWQGAGFTWSSAATSFTRSLQVHDNDLKATYNWGSISGTNLANIVTPANSGTPTYTIGGFVVRTINVSAFGWQSNIGVEISDYSKLSSSGTGQVLAWSVSNMNTRASLGNIIRPQASTWSASAIFTNPTTINILDQSATGSSSQASSFTIQETI